MRKAVEHVHQRLALGEQRLGGALDGVAGIDQQRLAARALGADSSLMAVIIRARPPSVAPGVLACRLGRGTMCPCTSPM